MRGESGGEKFEARWNRSAEIIARNRFVKGPARATKAISFLGSLKWMGLIGTGFAAPKIIGEPEKTKSAGIITLMTGSICGRGFKVKRPRIFAVGSPSLNAVNPCITSCSIAERIKMTSPITNSTGNIVTN